MQLNWINKWMKEKNSEIQEKLPRIPRPACEGSAMLSYSWARKPGLSSENGPQGPRFLRKKTDTLYKVGGRDFPGGPGAKILCSQCRGQVWSPVSKHQGSSGIVQPPNYFRLFATPWTAVHQPPCPLPSPRICPSSCPFHWWCHTTISSSDALFSFCFCFFSPCFCFFSSFSFSIFPSIRDFSNESVVHIRWPKYWNFIISISPSNEYSGLTSFNIDWLDLFAVQGTLRSPL